MSYIVHFTPDTMSSEQYEECMRELTAAGAVQPEGRLFHACYGTSPDLRVVDVWDSQESFERFGQTLMPLLQRIGVNPGPPEIAAAYNIIAG